MFGGKDVSAVLSARPQLVQGVSSKVSFTRSPAPSMTRGGLYAHRCWVGSDVMPLRRRHFAWRSGTDGQLAADAHTQLQTQVSNVRKPPLLVDTHSSLKLTTLKAGTTLHATSNPWEEEVAP